MIIIRHSDLAHSGLHPHSTPESMQGTRASENMATHTSDHKCFTLDLDYELQALGMHLEDYDVPTGTAPISIVEKSGAHRLLPDVADQAASPSNREANLQPRCSSMNDMGSLAASRSRIDSRSWTQSGEVTFLDRCVQPKKKSGLICDERRRYSTGSTASQSVPSSISSSPDGRLKIFTGGLRDYILGDWHDAENPAPVPPRSRSYTSSGSKDMGHIVGEVYSRSNQTKVGGQSFRGLREKSNSRQSGRDRGHQSPRNHSKLILGSSPLQADSRLADLKREPTTFFPPLAGSTAAPQSPHVRDAVIVR